MEFEYNSLSLSGLCLSREQLLLEGLMDAGLMLDDQGRIVAVNRAASELIGLSSASLMGRYLKDWVEPSCFLESLDQGAEQPAQAKGKVNIIQERGLVRVAICQLTTHLMPHRHLVVLREIDEWQVTEAKLALQFQLEQQVEQRTAELQQALQFEALLMRVIDQVRDNLDQQHILQAAVQELAYGLEIECCDTGLYNEARTQATIAYECTKTIASATGCTFDIATCSHSEIHQMLLQGQFCYFCSLVPNLLRPNLPIYTILACPIIDDQEVLGSLWLFKRRDQIFVDAEIRLVQQVANQCAIALRQSRLNQAIQAHIKELEHLNVLKDDFLSTVSHELRTPMSNIGMATQMLEVVLKQASLSESVMDRLDRYLEILRNECQREISLINDLLDLTCLQAGNEPLSLTSIALHWWIPHVAEVFAKRAETQKQELILHIPSDLPPLITDANYLKRILAELLSNACKYTPSGEQIRITVSLEPPTEVANVTKSLHQSIYSQPEMAWCLIQVTNTGVEIPQAECDRIFEKFYRIPNADPWKHGGTGLGLTLTQRLVERLGGQIAVRSGSGQTTFMLRLPLEAV